VGRGIQYSVGMRGGTLHCTLLGSVSINGMVNTSIVVYIFMGQILHTIRCFEILFSIDLKYRIILQFHNQITCSKSGSVSAAPGAL